MVNSLGAHFWLNECVGKESVIVRSVIKSFGENIQTTHMCAHRKFVDRKVLHENFANNACTSYGIQIS
jgi:hypothetical protein